MQAPPRNLKFLTEQIALFLPIEKLMKGAWSLVDIIFGELKVFLRYLKTSSIFNFNLSIDLLIALPINYFIIRSNPTPTPNQMNSNKQEII